jgi:uncharacterized membrane protein YgcG
MAIFANIIGIIGVALIVIAYFLNQSGKMASDSLPFPVLNLAGAVLILVSLWWSWNLPSFIMECIWISISAVGILRILKNTKAQANHD